MVGDAGIGEEVSTVAALDGNNFAVSAANPPIRGVFNGRAGIRCVGNDRAVFTPSIAATASQATFFIGLRLDNHFELNGGDTNVVFLYQTDAVNSEGLSISFDDSDQTYIVAFGPTSEGIRIPQRMLAGEVLLTIEYDSTVTNIVSVWINGNLFDTVSTTQGALGTDANEACFAAGASGDNTFGFFCAFNAVLTDSRRQDVEAWLLGRVTSLTATTGRFGGRGYALNLDHKWDHGDGDRIESSGSSSSSGSSRTVSSSSQSTATSSRSTASSSSESTILLSTSTDSSSQSASSQSSSSSSSSGGSSASSGSSSSTSTQTSESSSNSSSSSKNSSSSSHHTSSSQSESSQTNSTSSSNSSSLTNSSSSSSASTSSASSLTNSSSSSQSASSVSSSSSST